MNSSQNIHSCKIFLIIKNFIQSESCIFLKFLFKVNCRIHLVFVCLYVWTLHSIKCDVSNFAVVMDKVINVYTPPPPKKKNHTPLTVSLSFSFLLLLLFLKGLKHRIWSAPLDPPSKATIWKQFRKQYSSVVELFYKWTPIAFQDVTIL